MSIGDKRAILDWYGRADQEPVTASIRHLRGEINETLKQLGPDATAAPWLQLISAGIREYLRAVERAPRDTDVLLFAPALRRLRQAVREVAEAVADAYELPAAAELVAGMDRADADVDEWTRRQYEDPVRAYTEIHGAGQ